MDRGSEITIDVHCEAWNILTKGGGERILVFAVSKEEKLIGAIKIKLT